MNVTEPMFEKTIDLLFERIITYFFRTYVIYGKIRFLLLLYYYFFIIFSHDSEQKICLFDAYGMTSYLLYFNKQIEIPVSKKYESFRKLILH